LKDKLSFVGRKNFIVSIVIIVFFFIQSIFSQATVLNLNISQYDPNLMSEVYGHSYFLNSLTTWSEQITYYQGLIRGAWEASVDDAIYDYVDSITSSDAINDVAAYKDYVERSLFSQKEDALNVWEQNANLDLLQNKSEFIARLNTGRVNEVYFDRLIVQSSLLGNVTNETVNQAALQNQMLEARSEWESVYSDRYVQGNYDFTQAADQIERNYAEVINSLDGSDTNFQSQLTEIDKYKKEVKRAIKDMIDGFQVELNAACSVADGCAYRDNNGVINTAGATLQALVNAIRTEVDSTTISPSFSISTLATNLNTYLTSQRLTANSNYTSYQSQIYQVYNKFNDRTSIAPSSLLNMIGTINHAGYEHWKNISSEFAWGLAADFNNNPFNYSLGVGDHIELLHYMHTGNQAGIQALLQRYLSSDQSIRTGTNVYYNIYTRDTAFANKHAVGDNLGWTGIAKGGSECIVPLPCDNNAVKQGNMNMDRQNGFDYRTYFLLRGPTATAFQMDHVTFALAYEVYDANKDAHTTYWNGIKNSLNNQINNYEMNLIPAATAWESQVKDYNDFYTAWKVKADLTRTQATQERETALAALDERKQRWLSKIQDEFIQGQSEWDNLERQSVSVRSTRDANQFQNIAQIKLKSAYQDSTPTNTDIASVTSSFSANLTSLISETVNGVNLFNAESQITVNTSLNIGNKDITQILQTTVNGVYQYSQLLSVNSKNEENAIAEQRTMLNRQAFGIRWEDRAVGRFDENGNFVGDAKVNHALKLLTDTKGYEKQMAACKVEHGKDANCFGLVHGWTLNELKKDGYEYQDGMIVRSYGDLEDRIKLDILSEADKKLLTKEQKERVGSCYANPHNCVSVEGGGRLLREDFEVKFNTATKVATLTKVISNGRIEGRDASGKYLSGRQSETRTIALSNVAPVTMPTGKDLFDVWEQADWKDFSAQANAVMNNFYTKQLAKDNSIVGSLVADIRSVESANERKFQKAKTEQENHDSLVKDLIIAYISGGMAGVKGAIKGKIEDKINMDIATAFARATGADESQIGQLAQALSFMKGKVQERKIKKADIGSAILTPAIAFTQMFSSGGIMASVMYKSAVGEKKYEATINASTRSKDKLAAIKANEQSIIQSIGTQAVATSTGLPLEVVGNAIADYYGAKKAKKTRQAINANPVMNIMSQVMGIGGGIVKTAMVAVGVPERDIQEMISDSTRVLFSTTRDSTLEAQGNAFMNQASGMKAPGTSYTSSTPSIKDKKGFTKELGQRMAVEALSVGMTDDEKEILNASLRNTVSRYEQSRADKKARAEAVRSTAITTVTTAVTLGAAGAFGPALQGTMNAVSGSARLTAAILNGAVQTIDGSRNGTQGMLAGFANGFLGAMTANGNFTFSSGTGILSGTTLGLGVTYDRRAGWGGMIGIGGDMTNASISFSQRGNTTINASYNTSIEGVQVTGSSTTNGSTTVGVNYNPSNEGPRRGWNFGANYDTNRGQVSGTVGYTDSATGLGYNATIDTNGLSNSLQLHGVNLATMTEDGFQYDEMNWAEQNINLAQDMTGDAERARAADIKLRSYYTEDQIRGMDPIARENAIRIIDTNRIVESGQYTSDQINRMSEYDRSLALNHIDGMISADGIADATMGILGTTSAALLAFVGLGRGAGNAAPNNTTNNNVAVDAIETRRRKMYEGIDRDGYWVDPDSGIIYGREADGSLKAIRQDENGRLQTVVLNEITGETSIRTPNASDMAIFDNVRQTSGLGGEPNVVYVTDNSGGGFIRSTLGIQYFGSSELGTPNKTPSEKIHDTFSKISESMPLAYRVEFETNFGDKISNVESAIERLSKPLPSEVKQGKLIQKLTDTKNAFDTLKFELGGQNSSELLLNRNSSENNISGFLNGKPKLLEQVLRLDVKSKDSDFVKILSQIKGSSPEEMTLVRQIKDLQNQSVDYKKANLESQQLEKQIIKEVRTRNDELSAQVTSFGKLKTEMNAFLHQKFFDPTTQTFNGPLEKLNSVKLGEPISVSSSNLQAQFDRIPEVAEPYQKTLSDTAENMRTVEGLTKAQLDGIERANQTPDEFLRANMPELEGRSFASLEGQDRINAMNKLLDPTIVNQSKNGGMSKMVELVFATIRDQGKDNFTFAGDPSGSKNFEFIKNYIFGDKAASTDAIAKNTTAELCKVYANYTLAVANNKTSASFSEYLITKFRIGDIGADSSSPPKPVMDQNNLAGYTTRVESRLDLTGTKTGNNSPNFDFTDNGIVGVSRPFTTVEVNNILADRKPGEVVQVYRDTDRKDRPGGNHYNLIIKGTDGKWYDMNNNGERESGDFLPVNFKDHPVYGIYYDK